MIATVRGQYVNDTLSIRTVWLWMPTRTDTLSIRTVMDANAYRTDDSNTILYEETEHIAHSGFLSQNGSGRLL